MLMAEMIFHLTRLSMDSKMGLKLLPRTSWYVFRAL